MLYHLKEPVLLQLFHSLSARHMGASLIGRISRKLYVVHILVFVSLLKISQPPSQWSASSGVLPSLYSWKIYYDSDETHGMPFDIWLGAKKNNKLCVDFQWDYVSIMQKTNWIMQTNFDKIDKNAFWMYQTTVKQKALQSLAHSFNRMHIIFASVDIWLIFLWYSL